MERATPVTMQSAFPRPEEMKIALMELMTIGTMLLIARTPIALNFWSAGECASNDAAERTGAGSATKKAAGRNVIPAESATKTSPTTGRRANNFAMDAGSASKQAVHNNAMTAGDATMNITETDAMKSAIPATPAGWKKEKSARTSARRAMCASMTWETLSAITENIFRLRGASARAQK